MADGDHYQHVTVTTGPAVTVTLPTGARRVEVLNRSGAGEVYFTTNGTTPTAGGNHRVLPAVVGAAMEASLEGTVTVKLIASASTTVSVSVLP